MMAEPKSTRYRNWVKGGLGLLYAKQGIEDFVSDEINKFQVTILNNPGGSRCINSCTIQNVLRCPTQGMCGGRPCRFHDNTDPTKKPNTSCLVCGHINSELVKAHRYGRPSYSNTTPQQWCTNSWELAKCFMPQPGYSNKNSANETDFSGLINVVLNHEGFQNEITENLGQRGNTFEKARQVRNDILHNGNNELSTPELNNYIDTLRDVLQDPKKLQQLPDAQSALSKLQELKNDLITITSEDEVNVHKESIKELERITVEKMEEIEHFSDKKKEEFDMKGKEMEKSLDGKTEEGTETLDRKTAEGKQHLTTTIKEGIKTLDRTIAEGEQHLAGTLRSATEDFQKRAKELTNNLSHRTIDKKASSEEFSQNLQTDITYCRQSEMANYETRKGELQKEILDHYKTSGCTKVAMPALIKGKLTDIEDIFVMPSMKVVGTDQPADKGKIVSTIHKLFRTDNQLIRKVCVTGEAGHGKTTLCKSIVSNWRKIHTGRQTQLISDTDTQFLSKFQFLFCIQLRNHKTSDVIDMIKNELVRKPLHNTLSKVLEEESHTCLIVLDGLDEWQSSGASKCNVPYLDPKEKFTVLITSRAWKIEALRPTEPEIGREVKLCEVDQNALVCAIVKVLNSRTGKTKSMRDFFDYEGYEKAKQLSEVPILLSQMVCMWFDNEKIGETRLEIYGRMIDHLFHVCKRRQESGDHSTWLEPKEPTNTQLSVFFSELHFCRNYSNLLLKLSEVAYTTLFNCEKESFLVFSHSKTDLYQLTEDEVNFCLTVGILSQSIVSGKVASEEKTFSFLHKTFHEYLAAIFIAYGGTGRTVSAMKQQLQTLKRVFEMSGVIIFLSGMRPDMLADVSHHIAEIVDADESILRERARGLDPFNPVTKRVQRLISDCITAIPEGKNLDCKLELHDLLCGFPAESIDDSVDAVINIETVKSYRVHYSCETRIEKVLLTHHEPKHLTYLTLVGIRLTHSDIELLQSFLSRATQLNIITLGDITCTSCAEEQCHNIIDLSHHHQLHYLKLLTKGVIIEMYNKVHNGEVIDGHVGWSGSFGVNIVLSNETPLTNCCITAIKCSHSGIDFLSRAVSQCTQLERIKVEGIRCTTCAPGQCNYRIDLSNHTQLQTLDMANLNVCGQIILNNKIPLTHCQFKSIEGSHSDIEVLGMYLSQFTQLEKILLSGINCTTCVRGECNYRIDLSHHKQLHDLQMENLCGHIILSNEVPLTSYILARIERLGMSLSQCTQLKTIELTFADIKCTPCVQEQCNYTNDLSRHKQLQDLHMEKLDAHIILSNEVPLTKCYLERIECNHADMKVLGMPLSQCTQLETIKLVNIKCTTCVPEQCNYRIDLSRYKQLQHLHMEQLGAHIILSNEVPLTKCYLERTECNHADMEVLGMPLSQCTQLKTIKLIDIKCTTCVQGQCNYRIDLSRNKQLQHLHMEQLGAHIILSNEVPLTYCYLERIECTHAGIEVLGMSLSQCTQLNNIELIDIKCTTCVQGQCNYRIDLSRNKQLHHLHMEQLGAHIILSNEVPLTYCYLERIECTHAGIEVLGMSLSQCTQLNDIELIDIKCTTCVQGQCNYRIDLAHHKQLRYLHMKQLGAHIILSNEVPLYSCHLERIECTHAGMEVLGMSLSQCTQLEKIKLIDIKCTTCVPGQCNYTIDLSNYIQLQDLHMEKLGGNIILSNEISLTNCYLERIECTHAGMEVLGMSLSQYTQLEQIELIDIKCTTCVQGQCNYRIDLAHHKQLRYLHMKQLGAHIILSNEVPLYSCHLERIECSHSGIEVLGLFLSQCKGLYKIKLIDIKCTTCVQGQCNYTIDLSHHNQLIVCKLDRLNGDVTLSNNVCLMECSFKNLGLAGAIVDRLKSSTDVYSFTLVGDKSLSNTNSTTSTTTTVHNVGEVQPSQSSFVGDESLSNTNSTTSTTTTVHNVGEVQPSQSSFVGDESLSNTNSTTSNTTTVHTVGEVQPSTLTFVGDESLSNTNNSTTSNTTTVHTVGKVQPFTLTFVGDESLSNTNSTTSTTTTVHTVGEVQPSQSCFVGDESLSNTNITTSTTTTVHNVGEVQPSTLSCVGDESLSNTNITTSTTTTVHNVGEVQPSQLSCVGDESLSNTNSTTSTTSTVHNVGEVQPSHFSFVGDESLSNTNSTTSTTTTLHTVGEVQPSQLSFVGDESLSNTNSTTSTTTTVHTVGEVQPSTLSCVGDESLSNTNRTTSTTTTTHNVGEAQPSALSLSKILTVVIPTFYKLKKLSLSNVDFKQDILSVSPKLAYLREVNLKNISMTLQCFQGFIDSLPQSVQYTVHKINVENVSICPKEDLLSALQCITDSYTIRCMTRNVCTRDGVITSMVLQGVSFNGESDSDKRPFFFMKNYFMEKLFNMIDAFLERS